MLLAVMLNAAYMDATGAPIRTEMANILFVKTSSLGDVIHHMPALTEARRHRPNARFAWAVEEAFAPLVRLHPAASEVIPVGERRWRSQFYMPSAWPDMLAVKRALAAEAYDEIVDTQGLLKSALLVACARGRKHGYDRASIKEPLASSFYDVRHAVSRDLHAVDRNRILAGLALGYAPAGAPDYGFDREALRAEGEPYAVLLHGTARPGKEWPVASWVELSQWLSRNDTPLKILWGNDRERVRAGEIAQGVPGLQVPANKMALDAVARVIAGARFVIGVDTGLLHLAAALGVPLVAIFAGSEPRLTAPVGTGLIEVLGGKGTAPTPVEVMSALKRVTS